MAVGAKIRVGLPFGALRAAAASKAKKSWLPSANRPGQLISEVNVLAGIPTRTFGLGGIRYAPGIQAGFFYFEKPARAKTLKLWLWQERFRSRRGRDAEKDRTSRLDNAETTSPKETSRTLRGFATIAVPQDHRRPAYRFCRNRPRGSSITGFAFRIGHRRVCDLKDSLGRCLFVPLDSVAMRTQPKNPRQKPGRKSPAKGDQAKKRAKNRKTRPHSILLADLFLLIRVVDECLYHPTGALGRAAKTEGYGSVGNVAQRLDVLENRFGKLFYRNSSGGRRRADPRGDGRQGARLRSRAEDARADAQEPAQRLFPRQARLLPGEGQYRSGVPNFRAAALAELFAVIELLYSRAWSFGRAGFLDELHKLKEIIVHLSPRSAHRVLDDLDQNRIKASLTWRTRQLKTGRAHYRKKMSDWPPFSPSPVKPRARLSPTPAPSHG